MTDHPVAHIVAAGLTATSIAGAIGYLPQIIACGAGLMAMAAYGVTVYESETGKRVMNWWKNRK